MNHTTVKTFVIAAALTLSVSASWAADPVNGGAAPEKTNIVFIICDDLNDWIGPLGGHPQAQTPEMDTMAAEGVNFLNAACNAGLCSPSRASFLTGLYPHTSGYYGGSPGDVWGKHPVLSKTLTFMDYFTDRGYTVYGTGKLFHNGQEKEGVWTGKDGVERYGLYTNWGPWPWDGKKTAGFEWGRAVGHPNRPDNFGSGLAYASLEEIPDVPPNPKTGAPGYKGWRLNEKPFRYVSETDRDRMPDEVNADWVQEQLDTGIQEPFMICVGMNRPHVPLYNPQPFLDLYPLETLQLPLTMENDLDDVAVSLGRNRDPELWSKNDWGVIAYDTVMKAEGEAGMKKQVQAYLASVSFVDAQVGRVIQSIKDSPYADTTLIVLTSDHGFQLGEKKRLFKHAVWEDAVRVPFIVMGPGVAKGKTSTAPISLVDLFPTFIDYAGLPGHPHKTLGGPELDGNSIRPLLEDPDRGEWPGPDVNLFAMGRTKFEDKDPAHMSPPAEQHYSVRSERYRYILAGNGEEELYDHTKDPHEWTNLAANPEYAPVKKQLRAKMLNIIEIEEK